MPNEPAAVTLSLGRFQLVLGDEVAVTAMEVTTDGDQTRLNLADLRGATQLLASHGVELAGGAALFIISDARGLTEGPGGGSVQPADRVVIEAHGPADSAVIERLRGCEPDDLSRVIAEAAAAAWRQRLADAADCVDELSRADAEIVGPLEFSGRPLITDLRAERRRNLYADKKMRHLDDLSTAVDQLVDDLAAAVRFGAAGLAAASETSVADTLRSACGHGGWVDRLRLLIAAAEVQAIELLIAAGDRTATGAEPGGSSPTGRELVAACVERRQNAEDLAVLLEEAADRLPVELGNPAKRLLKRKMLSHIDTVWVTADAYTEAVTNAYSGDADTGAPAWNTTAQTLFELDLITAAEPDPRGTKSAEEAAAALGEQFQKQLPRAREAVAGLEHQHPGADAESKVQIVKRHAVRKLSTAREDPSGVAILEIVAELAMSIALLRGVEPRTDAEFNTLGERILARADKINALHQKAGAAVPQAFAGFEWLAKYVQPVLADLVFNAMSGAKPARPGAARDFYKTMRSKVWRARYDSGLRTAAAGGASTALVKAMDAAAPLLIVRYVDRSLPAPR